MMPAHSRGGRVGHPAHFRRVVQDERVYGINQGASVIPSELRLCWGDEESQAQSEGKARGFKAAALSGKCPRFLAATRNDIERCPFLFLPPYLEGSHPVIPETGA